MSVRILIVEDHPLNLELARDILEARGHTVDAATNVEEAVLALRGPRPDVILLDVQIPGGGGEVVLQHIRGDPGTARVPVVAVTAFAMDGDRERFLAQGFDAYISKPLDVRAFGPEVESIAGQAGAS